MGADQSSEEEYYEAPNFDSASENGRDRKKGMQITVKDMQPLGDGCFRAVGTDGFVHLLAERSSSLFTFVAYLASQRARQGYEHLIMEKRHLASVSKLELVTNGPPRQIRPLILQMPTEGISSTTPAKVIKIASKEQNDDIPIETDLEDQGRGTVAAATLIPANGLTFTAPPEHIPLLPSPFITGTPHLDGYDNLVAFRKINILGDFFWIRPEELEVFRLLTMSRIGETFFMRMCKEYMLECETSPQTRKMSLEAYVQENELSPYAVFSKPKKLSSSSKSSSSRLKMHENGLEEKKSQTAPEDAVRQVLRGYEAFEGSIKASIFTDNLLMLFVSIQKLLQNTIEAHDAVKSQTTSFDVSYGDLKEIKLLMDEVKQKLQDSYLHKNCPFKPEDVSTPPPTIIINNNNTNNNTNIVMLDMGTPHHGSSSQNTQPPPPPVNTTTYRQIDPHKQD